MRSKVLAAVSALLMAIGVTTVVGTAAAAHTQDLTVVAKCLSDGTVDLTYTLNTANVPSGKVGKVETSTGVTGAAFKNGWNHSSFSDWNTRTTTLSPDAGMSWTVNVPNFTGNGPWEYVYTTWTKARTDDVVVKSDTRAEGFKGCAPTTTSVTPVNPTIVDKCGTDDDTVTLPSDTSAIKYSKSGGYVYASLKSSSYVWGATPSGWAVDGSKLKYKLPDFDTTPCSIKVVPADPTIVDKCGVDNDTVTFASTTGVTYTRVGDYVVATLADGYVWGNTPSGWKDGSNGTLKYKVKLSDKPCYVIVAWAMPSWNGSTTPSWPQTYVTSEKQTEPNLAALDDDLDAIGYGCYQVDIYYDSQTTTDLIAGGHLTGPSNPPEDLISGGWGTAYKLYKVGNSCEPPKVDICVYKDGKAKQKTILLSELKDTDIRWVNGNECTPPTSYCVYTDGSAHEVSVPAGTNPPQGAPLWVNGNECTPPTSYCVYTDGTANEVSVPAGTTPPEGAPLWVNGNECTPPTDYCVYTSPDATGHLVSVPAGGEVPEGATPWTGSGDDCTPDVCPNIVGNQPVIPEGLQFFKTENGAKCGTPPTLEGTLVSSICESDVPWIDYEIKLNDPYGVSTNTTGNATFTFYATGTTETFTKVVPIGSGRFLWPGATATDNGDGTYTATGWPGWELQDGEWVSVGTDNYGWTRDGVTVLVEVNPTMTVSLEYPPPTELCVAGPPTEVHNELDAPPASAVEAEAQYAG